MTKAPTLPDPARLMAAVDATWPAAETRDLGPFRLRRGAGGGKRVSAAILTGPDWDQAAIDAAVAGMADWGQGPLFQIVPGQEDLDEALAAQGYAVIDPVVVYAIPAADIVTDEKIHVAHASGAIPVLMEEIWAAGGIGPARLAVMERVAGPKVRLLGRSGDRPAGTAFVGVDGDIAMIHAIEVRPALRRGGVARNLMQAAARFALRHGAAWLALVVVEQNAPARALYERSGMTVGARYHYRIKET